VCRPHSSFGKLRSALVLFVYCAYLCLIDVCVNNNNKSKVFSHVTDAENIFQVSSYPGNFFPSFFVFFQWHGDVLEDGGGLSISKLIEWKKKRKPISQVLQLQLHFSRFYFPFVLLLFLFPTPPFWETAVISFHFCF
jgi:hypothetical protein